MCLASAHPSERLTKYAVVIEKGERNFSAYVPDLPGCVSVGDTMEEAKAEIRDAIEFHLEGMREDGLPIPKASSRAEYVDVGIKPLKERPRGELVERAPPAVGSSLAQEAESVAEKRAEARMKSYVGEACPECAFTMARSGACLKCDTCGTTTRCT
jgi:predicted RNase H-like HicB family nuclease